MHNQSVLGLDCGQIRVFQWKMPNAPCSNDRVVVRHIATLLVNGFRGRVRICRTETLEVLLTRSVDSEVSE